MPECIHLTTWNNVGGDNHAGTEIGVPAASSGVVAGDVETETGDGDGVEDGPFCGEEDVCEYVFLAEFCSPPGCFSMISMCDGVVNIYLADRQYTYRERLPILPRFPSLKLC